MEFSMRSDADYITNLPNNIIDSILGCLPLRDTIRTSILSREWRYKWRSCPELIFDFWFDQMFLGELKLEPLVRHILKLHKGPLLKLALQVPDLKSSPEIDRWVQMLPKNTLQDLTLHVSRGDIHKLTSHLFALQQLRNLKLYNCALDHAQGFSCFSKLVNLDLQNVSLGCEFLAGFIACCPSLERLRLIHCTSFDCLEIRGLKLKCFEFHGVFKSVSFVCCPFLKDVKLTFSSMDFKGGNRFSFDLISSLSSLPSLEELQLQAYALEDLVEHGAPNQLTISLNTLKHLHLSDMYFEKIEETSCAISLIRSCPNLQRLKITAFTLDVVDSVADFLRSQSSSGSLAHLRTVKMQLFSGIEPEMEFVKYLLASAVALEEMEITPHAGRFSDGGESILDELKQYPRASARAAIISADGKEYIQYS